MDGPSTLISSTASSIFPDQTFSLSDYPPGDNVVIGSTPNKFESTNQSLRSKLV